MYGDVLCSLLDLANEIKIEFPCLKWIFDESTYSVAGDFGFSNVENRSQENSVFVVYFFFSIGYLSTSDSSEIKTRQKKNHFEENDRIVNWNDEEQF